jgi:spermidine synthase
LATIGSKAGKGLMAEAELIYSIMEEGRPIKVWQTSDLRWLEFGDDLIQTEIDLIRPDYLPESFNRAMLSGALFRGEIPQKVLLAGTGGGSTARYFSHRFPDVIGDAVDYSSVVLDIARRFFECPYQGNWQLIKADIREYVQQSQTHYDLIVMDIAIGQASPEWITDPCFLKACRQLLTDNGHMAINIIVENELGFMKQLGAIRQAFDRNTVCLSLAEHRNVIVLAFNQTKGLKPNPLSFDDLEELWHVEFGQFYQQMLKDNPKDSGVI